jgi:outer membrane protein assembly factor BamB
MRLILPQVKGKFRTPFPVTATFGARDALSLTMDSKPDRSPHPKPTAGRSALRPRAPRGGWPLPGHDNRYSAQAELPCVMPRAPREAWSYDPGLVPLQEALCVDVDDDGEDELLYGEWPLVCVTLSGVEKWRCDCGRVTTVADLDGDGHTELVASALERHDNASQEGQTVVVAGRNGRILWTRPGRTAIITGCRVAKLLPEEQGLQLACVSEASDADAKRAQVWSFAGGWEGAKLLWQRDFARPPDHSGPAAGRYGRETVCLAGCTWGGIVLMRPEDGADLFRLYWECAPGEAGKRNYGPLLFTDLDGDGQNEIAILAGAIQLHITVLAPWRGAPGPHADPQRPLPAPDVPMGELASYSSGPMLWQRYFGSNQPTGTFSLSFPLNPVADVDGDGKLEIVANVYTDSWTVKVYDGMTGAEKLSLPGVRAEALWDLDEDGIPAVVARQDANLLIGSIRHTHPAGPAQWTERSRFEGCSLAYAKRSIVTPFEARIESVPLTVTTPKGPAWILSDEKGRLRTLHSTLNTQHLTLDTRGKRPASLTALAASRDRLVVTERGAPHLALLSVNGKTLASWQGGTPCYSGVTVADIDADGRNELVVCRAGGRVAVVRSPRRPGGQPTEWWSAAGSGFPQGYPVTFPVALTADVNRDGKQEILVGGGRGGRLLNSRGKTIWETEIPLMRAVFGDFDGDGHLDVYAASLVRPAGDSRAAARLQSYALNGRTGAILWHNDGAAEAVWHHQMGPTPTWAMPTVYDVNGDGIEDVLFVALDLLVELNGRDGTFLHEPVKAVRLWEQQHATAPRFTAYGTQMPVDLDGDGKWEILLTSSWGHWGAWTLDRKLLWTFDPGASRLARRHAGVADVDGDGTLEIGVIHDDGAFRCYNAATGALKWEIPEVRQTSDVVTADVDGDGLPEFVASLAAYKAVDTAHGKLLWEVDIPVSQCPPVVADVDGDGQSEIIVGLRDGTLRVYK